MVNIEVMTSCDKGRMRATCRSLVFLFSAFALTAAMPETFSREELDALDACVQEMRAAKDEKAFAMADLEFHRVALQAAGNAFFFSVVSLVGAALLSLLRLSSPELRPEQQNSICDGHQRIADAIRARDTVAAQDAMRGVIDVGWSRVFGDDRPALQG